MKMNNSPRIQTRLSTTRVIIYSSLVIATIIGIVVFFTGTFSAKDSSANNKNKNKTKKHILSKDLSASKGNSFFAKIRSGDTLVLDANLTIDANLSVLKNRDIVLIIDGSAGKLTVGKKQELVIGSESEIIIQNGGSLESPAGECDTSPKIFIGSTEVTNCRGTTIVRSFSQVEQEGGITGSITPLPVSWLATRVERIDEFEYEVFWSTASELNNDYFLVEYMDNAGNWIEGPIVPSKAISGNSQSILEYSVRLTNYATEDAIFRIKQVDFDGQFEYSELMKATASMKHNFRIATLGNNKIRIYTGSREEIPVLISAMNGDIVLQDIIEDSKEFTLPVAGPYVIEIGEAGKAERVKHMVR
jgi:hypothetical protein